MIRHFDSFRLRLYLLLAGFTVAAFSPAPSVAQSNLVDGQLDGSGPLVQIDTTFGYSKIEEDSFLRLDAGIASQIGALAFAVHAPVHIRLLDREPLSDSTVREEDWDELGDYFRIIRFVQWGARERPDPVYVRAGELVDVSLGHRSVVDRYFNVVDTNHHKLGIQGEWEADYGGLEFFLDHVAPAEIIGSRAYVRPFTFVEGISLLKSLSTGLTFVTDIHAPLDFRAGSNERDFEIGQSGKTLFYGWDIDWALVELDWLEWVPYFDIMAMDDAGVGLHGGHFVNLYMDTLSINGQLEWRFATDGYQPGYFSSLYEIEKWSFIGADGTQGPKLKQTRENPRREDRHGIYAGLDFTLGDSLSFGGTYEEYQGPNNSNLTLRLLTPYLSVVKFGLFYAKRNFEGAKELLRLRNTLLISQTRVQVFGPVFVSTEYAHTFRESGVEGYQGTHNYHVGAGAEFSF